MGRPRFIFHHAEKVLNYLILSLIFSDRIVGVCVSFNMRMFLYKLVLITNYFGFDFGILFGNTVFFIALQRKFVFLLGDVNVCFSI